MAVNKWMSKVQIKKGALHEQLGIPQDKKIPTSLLQEKEHAKGKLGRRVRLALRYRGL